MFATVLLTGNNKSRSKVKRDCGAQILVCSSGKHCVHTGTGNSAHGIAGRKKRVRDGEGELAQWRGGIKKNKTRASFTKTRYAGL